MNRTLNFEPLNYFILKEVGYEDFKKDLNRLTQNVLIDEINLRTLETRTFTQDEIRLINFLFDLTSVLDEV